MIKNNKPKLFYGYVIVSVAFVVMFVGLGTINSFGVFLEPVLVEFGWTRAMTSGAFSLCFLVYAIMTIGAGRLNDRFGPRILLIAGGLFFGLGYFLMSRITFVWHLYAFFGVIIGAGFAAYFIPTLSTVARWFVERRGLMTGIVLSGIGSGTMVISQLAGWLITSYNWRITFIVMGMMSLLLITPAAYFLRRDPLVKGLLPDGGSETEKGFLSVRKTELSLQTAIRTKQLWMLGGAFFLFGFAVYAILVHIVIHATDMALGIATAVNILSIIGGVSIVGRIVFGSASDRIGSRPTLFVCFIILSIAFFWLLPTKELWMLYVFSVIFGLGYGGAFAMQSPSVAEFFGLRAHGVIFGVVDSVATIGATIGPVVLGYMFDKYGSYQLGFLICGITSIVASILILFLKPVSNNKESVVLPRSA